MIREREKSLQLVWLKAFIAVSEGTKQDDVAKSLGVSQSQVSRYLSDLDYWLGRVLMTDDVPPELTTDGQRFKPLAEDIIKRLEDFRKHPAEPATSAQKVSAKDITL